MEQWHAQVLQLHRRPVAFAKFMGRNRLVTASVDSSLALWSLNGGGGAATLLRCYRGHANHKNFVGLSVRECDELMACGSEQGAVFAYHRAWSRPVAQHRLSFGTPAQSSSGPGRQLQPSGAASGQGPASAGREAERQGPQSPAGTRDAGGSSGGQGVAGAVAGEFASAVCWWPSQLEPFGGRCGGAVLAAAQSNGDLRLLTLVNSC